MTTDSLHEMRRKEEGAYKGGVREQETGGEERMASETVGARRKERKEARKE